MGRSIDAIVAELKEKLKEELISPISSGLQPYFASMVLDFSCLFNNTFLTLYDDSSTTVLNIGLIDANGYFTSYAVSNETDSDI